MNSRVEDAELSSMVADQAERFFADFVTKSVLTRADAGHWQEPLWAELVAVGFPMASVPESAGGIGLPVRDVFALIRRAAYYAVPLPLAETLVARALWQVGGAHAPMGDPQTVWTLPFALEQELSLHRKADAWCVSGTAACVPWGVEAHTLLALAREAGGSCHLVTLPLAGQPASVSNTLAHEPRADIELQATPVSDDAVLPAPAFIACHGFKHYCALVRCQQMVGAMQRALDYALDYARERVQFGQAIGKMPAVQALLVQAAAQSAAAAAATDAATAHFEVSLNAGTDEDFDLLVAVAKTRVGEAAGEVAAACHQVHGAMGFTQEHPLHFATRRLWSWRDEAGGEGYWQRRIGDQVCARGGAALWPWLTAL